MILDYIVIILLLSLLVSGIVKGVGNSIKLFITVLLSCVIPMVVIKLFKDNLNDSFFNKLGNIFYKVFRLFTDLSSENAKVFMIILVLSIVIFLVVYNLLELLKNQMKVVKQNLSQVSRWFGGFIGLCTGFVLALFTVYVMMLLYPIDKTTIVIKTFIKLIEVLKI